MSVSLWISRLHVARIVFTKPIKTTITSLPIVIKINSFKYFIQIGDFNYVRKQGDGSLFDNPRLPLAKQTFIGMMIMPGK